MKNVHDCWAILLAGLLVVALPFGVATAVEPLAVCATTPDLGSIATSIGQEDVAVRVFARGSEDPHFLEAKPSFIKALSRADLLILNGLDLEVGWLPALLANCRNARVLRSAAGHLDASVVIPALHRPAVPLDRSFGDVHPNGNPHYLTDPINGLRVAALIRDRLSELRPERAAAFRERYQAFEKLLVGKLAGEEIAARRGLTELERLDHEPDFLVALEKSAGASAGGWLARLAPRRGAKLVADHDLWPYFTRRFGLEVAGYLEPLPGIAPTTRHLEAVIALIAREKIGVLITVPYYDPRHARFVAEKSGVTVVALAHQCGAVEATPDYLSAIEHNVLALEKALAR